MAQALHHGHRLRIGRHSESNRIYLTTAVTGERHPLFHDLALGREVVNSFRFQQAERRADTLAFVVMPDHFHWLLQLGTAASLSQVMHSVKSYSANRIGRRRGTAGPTVWQAGYHDHAVRREEALIDIARYIIANPLRAGLVRRIGDYPLWDCVWLA